MRARRLVRTCLLFLSLALLVVSALLAFIGYRHWRPDQSVSDLAQTFGEPRGRYMVFYGSTQFEAAASDKWNWPMGANSETLIRTGGGRLGIRWLRAVDIDAWLRLHQTNVIQGSEWHFERFGISLHFERVSDCAMSPNSSKMQFGHMDFVVLPWWIFAILFGWYPALILIVQPLRRRSRRSRGLCIQCGYNLTGAPEPRCPECGTRSSESAPSVTSQSRASE